MLCLLGLCLLAGGCARDLETAYGRLDDPGAAQSINGTAVLAGMFQHAGHKVSSASSLTPSLLRRADCIVWFPDDFQPPSDKVCDWFESWLNEKPNRTLIYVGRDFDAEPWYWEKVAPAAPAERSNWVANRRARAARDFRTAREKIAETAECPWFTIQDKSQPRKVRSLAGKPDWLAGIDPARLEIELVGRIVPSKDADVLLRSEDDVLLSKQECGDGRVLVAANGSFLLSVALVNHEHRKLAGKLIDAVGSPGQKVVFLESGHGGPPIRDQDEGPPTYPTGLEIFNVWPTNWILLHLSAVGILLCFARLPLFGRPQPPEPPETADFGKHLDAVADLLARSGDDAYARSRLSHYRQLE
ncbi:MAG: hypothetical protein ABSG68_22005 [Thermoguttaceae bacterium]|jgi:hypothetical protein